MGKRKSTRAARSAASPSRTFVDKPPSEIRTRSRTASKEKRNRSGKRRVETRAVTHPASEMTGWKCASCGHAHKMTRRAVEKHARCTRCACVRGDVLHKERAAGVVYDLFRTRPLQNVYPFRIAGDVLETRCLSALTPNPHASPGSKLYARFARAFDKSKDKTVRVMFHGTSAHAASNICRHGMDPSKRVSGGDWFTEDPNYALSRAISREEGIISSGNATCWLPASGPASATDAVPAVDDGVPPANGSVRMLAVAVLLDESTKIGDHVVCKNHHHALPLFVMDFRRLPGDGATSAL